MTADEFNTLGFKANDRVEITMNDGSTEVVMLYSGNAYLGRGEYENYSLKKIVPAEPAKLLFIDYNDLSKTGSINLEDIAGVKKLED